MWLQSRCNHGRSAAQSPVQQPGTTGRATPARMSGRQGLRELRPGGEVVAAQRGGHPCLQGGHVAGGDHPGTQVDEELVEQRSDAGGE